MISDTDVTYGKRKQDGVEKALNLKSKLEKTNELPENIDVTFTKTDVEWASEVVNIDVEKVLNSESDSMEYESAESNESNLKTSSSSSSEDEQCFHDKYLDKSGSNLDVYLSLVADTIKGSDKLYSDQEFPIQNMNYEKIDQVCKMIEISKSEIENLSETYYSKPKRTGNNNYKGKNYPENKRKGLGYEKKRNDRYQKPNYKKKVDFVFGSTTVSEKERLGKEPSNDEFYAQKKQREQANKSTINDSQTCFKCHEVGHIVRNCPKRKPVHYVSKTSDGGKGKTAKFVQYKILKRGEESTFNVKPTIFKESKTEIGETSKSNEQIDSKYYFKKAKATKTWVAKSKSSSEVKVKTC
ncbi:putative transcription factor interactor and regulator CCHC(Zn) family [Helianthus anomalus]